MTARLVLGHFWQPAYTVGMGIVLVNCLARQLDCELSAEWHPREDQLQQHADMLSKLVDHTEYSLSDAALASALLSKPAFPKDPAGLPKAFTLDVYASQRSSKVAGRFYSRFYCEGTLGVNALRHPWSSLHGSQQFCYIFGPFGLMPETVKKIAEERCEGVLVYPDWHHRGWRASIEAWKQKVIATPPDD